VSRREKKKEGVWGQTAGTVTGGSRKENRQRKDGSKSLRGREKKISKVEADWRKKREGPWGESLGRGCRGRLKRGFQKFRGRNGTEGRGRKAHRGRENLDHHDTRVKGRGGKIEGDGPQALKKKENRPGEVGGGQGVGRAKLDQEEGGRGVPGKRKEEKKGL